MRARRAVEEDADRERDRNDDAADDTEDEDAAEGDERERDRGADVTEAPDRTEIDQAGGRDDDGHAERRLGQRLDQRHCEQEEEPNDRRGGNPGGPRARAAGG